MTHKEQLLSRAVEYLDSQNWHYDLDAEKGVIKFGLNIDSKLKNCRMFILVEEDNIQSFAVCPMNASKDVYGNVVEFITRANYGLKLGNFEFDYSDGEIRYQCCMACGGGVPSLVDVERCIDIGFIMLQRYGDGLVKNLMGYGNPEADIKAIEG